MLALLQDPKAIKEDIHAIIPKTFLNVLHD
jgi:hypothetical protein